MSEIHNAAKVLLDRATQLDNEKRYSEALTFYREGLDVLIEFRRTLKDKERKQFFKSEVDRYLTRSEVLYKINKMDEESRRHQQQYLVAKRMLEQACDKEEENRYPSADAYYVEGIGMLMELRLTIPVGQLKKACGRDLEYYVGRYEVLKQSMEAMKEKHFKIEENSRGHTYETLFGQYLDERVTNINIVDPYLSKYYQVDNFRRFSELCAKKCVNLREIVLTTKESNDEGIEAVKYFLSQKGISLSWSALNIHYREISLNNGVTIKIDRGLDIFKCPEGEVDRENFMLRKMRAIAVDIYRQ